ncbi:MAG TPA: polyhydroxyalkanoate synthesis regulator DNA-binding domain-containing protein [Patescibacteria group bacterium]|jgi:polyhydroxyalkanoate synthesis repressor PhaR|nr:polyhydroxyalkanoate synthesis regulator DNA-binding domain-containing protein [Patescibacteria group bacterium]
MIIIKRYPNRKLYNTTVKKYVTLDGIAQLILEGEEIQILDHSSGEDLTAVTLTQIIFEQEKKESGFIPRSVLTGLIQSGGQTLGSLRRTLASPLNLRLHVDMEIERRLKSLTSSGELTEKESQDLRQKLMTTNPRDHEAALPTEAKLEQLLADRGIPTEDDIKELNERLDELVAKLDEIDLNLDRDNRAV